MAIYFSQNLMVAGTTSRPFTLPAANSDNSARAFVVTATRDMGAKLSDGSLAANQAAIVTIQQLAADNTTQVVLLNDNFIGAVSQSLFIPDPRGGVITIVQAGPGDITNIAIEDGDNRG